MIMVQQEYKIQNGIDQLFEILYFISKAAAFGNSVCSDEKTLITPFYLYSQKYGKWFCT